MAEYILGRVVGPQGPAGSLEGAIETHLLELEPMFYTESPASCYVLGDLMIVTGWAICIDTTASGDLMCTLPYASSANEKIVWTDGDENWAFIQVNGREVFFVASAYDGAYKGKSISFTFIVER